MKITFKKINTSKLITSISIIQFILVAAISIIALFCDCDSTLLCYLIPASAGIMSISIAFYYNKAKMENLSKQRIRYAYLKLLLENKLSPEIYCEIENEISNIDDIINSKLSNHLSSTIDVEIEKLI